MSLYLLLFGIIVCIEKQMKIFFCIIFLMLFATGCSLNGDSLLFSRQYHVQPADEPTVNSPAADYCRLCGGRLEIKIGRSGSIGICRFDDGSRCEQWSLLRGDCRQGEIK